MDLNDRQVATRFLLRDHDAKFTGAFDEIFRTEGAEVIRTPIRAPKGERLCRAVGADCPGECLDWTLVRGPICCGCCRIVAPPGFPAHLMARYCPGGRPTGAQICSGVADAAGAVLRDRKSATPSSRRICRSTGRMPRRRSS